MIANRASRSLVRPRIEIISVFSPLSAHWATTPRLKPSFIPRLSHHAYVAAVTWVVARTAELDMSPRLEHIQPRRKSVRNIAQNSSESATNDGFLDLKVQLAQSAVIPWHTQVMSALSDSWTIVSLRDYFERGKGESSKGGLWRRSKKRPCDCSMHTCVGVSGFRRSHADTLALVSSCHWLCPCPDQSPEFSDSGEDTTASLG